MARESQAACVGMMGQECEWGDRSCTDSRRRVAVAFAVAVLPSYHRRILNFDSRENLQYDVGEKAAENGQ